MTNAQLNTLINTIETGGLNTALEVRDVLQGIKNEMFQSSHIQEILSNGSNFNYKLEFNKIGNFCFLNGIIRNETQNIISSFDNGISITNPIFYPKNTSIIPSSVNNFNLYVFDTFFTNNWISLLQTNNLTSFDAMLPVGWSFNINGFYKIND
jgi:hypothetical protein